MRDDAAWCRQLLWTRCDTITVSAPPIVPELVTATLNLSRERGFITSTRHETGRLLAALAASRTGTLGELGTGCGVGSAWLSAGARSDSRIVTAELDPAMAEDVQKIFADVDGIEVIAGDWTSLEQFAPFALLFIDVREVMADIDRLAGLMEPGGIAVLDDFTPSQAWPPITEGRVDTVREQWLTDPRFTAVQMLIDANAALLIATRR